eukprot:15339-Rhodomonas_salina.1
MDFGGCFLNTRRSSSFCSTSSRRKSSFSSMSGSQLWPFDFSAEDDPEGSQSRSSVLNEAIPVDYLLPEEGETGPANNWDLNDTCTISDVFISSPIHNSRPELELLDVAARPSFNVDHPLSELCDHHFDND